MSLDEITNGIGRNDHDGSSDDDSDDHNPQFISHADGGNHGIRVKNDIEENLDDDARKCRLDFEADACPSSPSSFPAEF